MPNLTAITSGRPARFPMPELRRLTREFSAGVLVNEPFQRLDTERELAPSQGAFRANRSGTQSSEVFRQEILRAVDDPEVFLSTALDGGLNESSSPLGDEVERFDHHPFAADGGHVCLPRSRCVARSAVVQVNDLKRRSEQETLVRGAESCQHLHMPRTAFVCMNRALAGEQVEWSKL
jgi:hypothetical protein